MPIKRFWLLSENVTRIQASEHRMLLSTIACSRHGEMLSERSAQLDESVGVVVLKNEKRDRDAARVLKELM